MPIIGLQSGIAGIIRLHPQPGGGTPGAGVNPDLPGPGGGSPGAVGIILQGQSNAIFWYDDDGTFATPVMFNNIIQALTNLSGDQISVDAARGDFTPASASLFTGSFTYSFGGSPNWLEPIGHTLNDPTTWANTEYMDAFIDWSINLASFVPAGRPIMLIRMHNEYDSTLTDAGEISIYEAANREFIRRWRVGVGRTTALLPVFQVPVPYGNAQGAMTAAMRTAWHNQSQDNTQNFYLGVGSTLDAEDRGDASHWTGEAAKRVARRMAIRMAKWLHVNGYSARALDSLPTFGPAFTSFARVAGAANRLDLKVTHDGGTDLIVPASPELDDFDVRDNNVPIAVTAAIRQDASTVRLTLASNLSPGGPITVDYGASLNGYRGPDSQITDNWHTLSKPVSNAELNQSRMIMQRLRAKLTDGSTSPPPPPPPPRAAYDPPVGWVKTFADDFTQPPTYGADALDPDIWKQRGYGGSAHGGSSTWNQSNNIESTGSTVRVHNTRVGGGWYTDGFQAGYQNSNPGGDGYHAGFKQFHYRFRARYSHAYAPGVGGYALMWPASNNWSSELDWVEMPGDFKDRADATMHWDSRGEYDLNTNNQYTVATTSIDLTQWNVWDCRRTYARIGGVDYATIEVWINGEKVQNPGEWDNNPWMNEDMVPGFAGFVAPIWAEGWYGTPRADTPSDSYFEIDYAYIWEPTGDAVEQSPTTLFLTPADPGTLSESSPGAGAIWSTTIASEGIASLSWARVGPPPTYTFLGPVTTIPTTGIAIINVVFHATNEFLKVWDTDNPSQVVDSGNVTIVGGTQTGRFMELNPQEPGPRTAGPCPITVITTGVSSITWVLVNANFSWATGGQSVPTGGSVTVTPNFTTSGQFVKVFDTNDASFAVDSGPVTII